MRSMSIFVAVWLLTPLFASVSAQQAKDDGQKLQGTWVLTELVVGGVKVPDKEIRGTRFVFEGTKLTIVPSIHEEMLTASLWTFAILSKFPVIPETDSVVDRRTFTVKLDPAQKPAAVDLTALDGDAKGAVSPGIYEIKGDTLRWCQSDDEKNTQRPKTFESPAKSRIYVFTFKRAGK
jgi:uncharacterized protein (TIGR03067 family)